MVDQESIDRQLDSADDAGRPRRILRTVLLFAGSAVFGGLAVALWDRKTLAAMRRKEEEPVTPARVRDEDIY